MWQSLVLLASLLGQGKNEGEQLFRQVEAKLSKAKTLEFSFDISVEAAQGGKFKGSLASMSGRKARMELDGAFAGQPAKMLMISDGTQMKASGSGQESPPQDAPKGLDDMIRAMVARAGMFLPLFMAEPVEAGQKQKEFKPDEQVAVSEFRLGKAEKLGEREAQSVEYKLTMKAAKEPFAVVVWIDPKTSLPLKRVVSGKMDGQKFSVTESYTNLALDGKLDEKKFVLPK